MPHETVTLGTAVRDAIAASLVRSTVDARTVAERVCEAHPELVRRHGRDLALNALTTMARREIKRWLATGTSAKEQLRLPGLLQHLLDDLPPAVWVPTEDGEGAYRTFNGSHPLTCAELDLAIAALESQIAADTRKCAALKEVRDFANAAGAAADDAVLSILRGESDAA